MGSHFTQYAIKPILPVRPDGHPNSPTYGHLKFPHPERGVTMV